MLQEIEKFCRYYKLSYEVKAPYTWKQTIRIKNKKYWVLRNLYLNETQSLAEREEKIQDRLAYLKDKILNKKPKKRTKSEWKTRARKCDIIFSKYIRLRDARATTHTTTKGKCCTCGRIVTGRNWQCWHRQKRGNYPTRRDEKNCAGQCGMVCNNLGDGKMWEMEKYIDKRRWAWTTDRLKQQSIKTMKFTVDDLKKIHATYEKKYIDLKNKIELLKKKKQKISWKW